MDGFDLNIQNYTIKELKGLLSLSDVYDTYDVNSKKENICKKVSNDDTMTIDMKIKIWKNGQMMLLYKTLFLQII
jgi:hypothetical protein